MWLHTYIIIGMYSQTSLIWAPWDQGVGAHNSDISESARDMPISWGLYLGKPDNSRLTIIVIYICTTLISSSGLRRLNCFAL